MSSLELADIVHKEFVATVNDAEVNSELKRFVLSHERKGVFLQNIALEITRGKKFFLPDTIRLAVHDMTLMFLKNVERHANEKVMSDSEKNRIISEANELAEFDKQASEIADQIEVKTYGQNRKTN